MPESSSATDQPIFYYDFSSPYCWIAAERVMGALPVPAIWQPVDGRVLLKAPTWDGDRARAEKLAKEAELPALRWPTHDNHDYHGDVTALLRAAIFTKQIGRAVAFSLAAFRQAYNAGRDLGEVDNVLIAAAACELHPRAILKAIESETVIKALATATAAAEKAGVTALPMVVSASPENRSYSFIPMTHETVPSIGASR